jgi:hypothetical protein
MGEQFVLHVLMQFAVVGGEFSLMPPLVLFQPILCGVSAGRDCSICAPAVPIVAQIKNVSARRHCNWLGFERCSSRDPHVLLESVLDGFNVKNITRHITRGIPNFRLHALAWPRILHPHLPPSDPHFSLRLPSRRVPPIGTMPTATAQRTLIKRISAYDGVSDALSFLGKLPARRESCLMVNHDRPDASLWAEQGLFRLSS